MKKFYKLIALAMVATMTVSLFTGCSSSSSTPDVDEETLSLAAEIFADVEPLEETLSIDLGILTAAPHGFNNVLIELLGGYSYANLDANLEVFGSGPVLIEAMVSGAVDAGIYGLGGTLPGTITHGLINIAPTAPDYDGLKIFAPNDSEIVLSGMDESTGIYGTAEMWEGQEIFCSVGTTLYYALAKGLDRVGLSLDDVTVTHMSPENTNTALRAGQCEIGGLWGTLSYGDILENFTPVISAGDVDVNIITQFAAPQESLSDPDTAAAIGKWMELYYAAAEWMYASQENFDQTLEWFAEWNEENGVTSTYEELEIMCNVSGPFTLEEAYEIVSTESPISGMSDFHYYSYDPLLFYVSLGNYSEEDAEIFSQSQYYDTSIIEGIYANKN